jgi:hypothetical protein
MNNLQELAREFYELDQEAKEIEKRKKNLRSKILEEISIEYEYKEYLLPVQLIEVPNTFFESTSMSVDDFITSRFPG